MQLFVRLAAPFPFGSTLVQQNLALFLASPASVVLVGRDVKRAQICFLCGLEVKLVLNCFGVR